MGSGQLIGAILTGGVTVEAIRAAIVAYRTRRDTETKIWSLDRTQPAIDAQIAIQGFSELADALQEELKSLRTEVDRCKAQHADCEKNTAQLRREVIRLERRVHELESREEEN